MDPGPRLCPDCHGLCVQVHLAAQQAAHDKWPLEAYASGKFPVAVRDSNGSRAVNRRFKCGGLQQPDIARV